MKKSLIAVALLIGITSLNSCKKDNKSDDNAATETSVPTEISNEAATTPEVLTAAEPKSYTVNVAPGTPETILLGKNKEASVKIINLKAIDLSNPDGKSLGIQLSYDIELTNKNAIGGSSVQIDPAQFRLELDNGKKITHDDYNSVSTSAESSATSTGNIFKIPAGAKPIALNLFLDETRVTVKLELK